MLKGQAVKRLGKKAAVLNAAESRLHRKTMLEVRWLGSGS
jgi:hypothetical protein